MRYTVESLTEGVENEVRGASPAQVAAFFTTLIVDKVSRRNRPSLVVRLGADRYVVRPHEEVG